MSDPAYEGAWRDAPRPPDRERVPTRSAPAGAEEAVARAHEALRAGSDAQRSLASVSEALAEGLGGCVVGVLLDDADGLRVAAASSDSLKGLLCVDAACGDGPARMAHRTGRAVACHRLPTTRFPRFSQAAGEAGCASSYGIPIARDDGSAPLGALLVVSRSPRALDRAATATLSALAGRIALELSPDGAPGAPDAGVSGDAPAGKDHKRRATHDEEKDALA